MYKKRPQSYSVIVIPLTGLERSHKIKQSELFSLFGTEFIHEWVTQDSKYITSGLGSRIVDDLDLKKVSCAVCSRFIEKWQSLW